MHPRCVSREQNLAGKQCWTLPFVRVPPKLGGLYGEDEHKYGYDNGMEVSQKQIGRPTRWIGEWKLTTAKSRYNAEYQAEEKIHGCTKQFDGWKHMKTFGRGENGTQKDVHWAHAAGSGL